MKNAELKQFEGSLCITRPQGGNRDGKISIRIGDANNHCHFLELLIPHAEFAQAITGLSNQRCEVEVRMNAPIGKKLESKEILIPRVNDIPWNERHQRVNEALVPYETEGWRGRTDDMLNHHRWCKDAEGHECSRVVFHRYVDYEEER